MIKPHQFRIAKPAKDLERLAKMYCQGLDLIILGAFTNHSGFDGIILGTPEQPYHLEFTRSDSITQGPKSPEDLWVFYYPDRITWEATCINMLNAGFTQVESTNPYWNQQGKTFADAEGNFVVIQNQRWTPRKINSEPLKNC